MPVPRRSLSSIGNIQGSSWHTRALEAAAGYGRFTGETPRTHVFAPIYMLVGFAGGDLSTFLLVYFADRLCFVI
jgi:hypothetical protein